MTVDVKKLIEMREPVNSYGEASDYEDALVEACSTVESGGGGLLEEIEGLRTFAADARDGRAELERLGLIRDAGLKYIAAHRRWKTVHPHDESALMATCRAVSEADEALRKLLETEEKIVADERRARGTP